MSMAADSPSLYDALKEYEEELIQCLQYSDILILASQAAESKIITFQVKENLELLDRCVPRPVVCRYLLYSIYSSTNDYEVWFDLLSKLEAAERVSSQINQWHTDSSDTTFTESKQQHEIVLSTYDVPYLTEILVGCSSKWKEIATSLRLSDNEIRNVMAMMHMFTPIMCLKEVLSIWVSRSKYSCTKPPTLKFLESALRSQLVGLGVEANELRENFSKSVFERSPRSSRNTSEQLVPDVHIGQKFEVPNIEYASVAIGCAILFEGKVKTKSQNLGWYVDDRPLSSGSRSLGNHCVQNSYHGCNVSILYVVVKDIMAEGTYTCKCQLPGRTLMSQRMVLAVTTPVDKHLKVLTDFYTEQPVVPEDTWPPVSSSTFISLALIKQESIQHAGEYGRCTIRGDADDIYKNKESIMYESAFCELSTSERLLVEGRPGSGKTTLVHKVSQDWANRKLAIKHIRLLILVHLRAFSNDPKIKLYDILECFYSSSVSINDIVSYAEQHSGLGLCFILDGLDEYLPDNPNAFIFRLIKKNVLPKAVVIVASRPAAAAKFRSVATRQIEVLGFLNKQILDYLESYPFSVSSKRHDLRKYLDLHPNVYHMCYLPIHAAMVCFLFDNIEEELPQTETEIYKEFTKYTILRILYRYENNTEMYIQTMRDLASPQFDLYMKICELAYNMTLSSKQVMQQAEVQSFFKIFSEKDSLGLLAIDRLAKRCGFQKLFTFLHLTFQEFLGAYYISNLEKGKQMELIEKFGKAKQMQQVWKFYCGLVQFNGECGRFKALTSNSEYGTLFNIQCSFESQQSLTCDYIIDNNSLSLTDTFLSPSNFSAIAYVIFHAQQNPVVRLSFEDCVFGQEGVDLLIKKAGSNFLKVTTLSYHGHNYVGEQLQVVNNLMHSLPSLEIFDISNTILGETEVQTLSEVLSHSCLQVVKVGSLGNPLYSSLKLPRRLANILITKCKNFVNICFSGSRKMIKQSWPLPFYFYSDLPDLDMSFCKMSPIEIKTIFFDYSVNPIYNKLSFVCCGLDDLMVTCLAGGLKYCRNLEVLELSGNDIHDDGAINISDSIKHCSKLLKIDLSCNKIGHRGAMVLTDTLKGNSYLKLCLWNNCFGDIHLNNNNNIDLHSLEISNRDIQDKDAALLACLVLSSDNCTLHRLLLTMNRISAEGWKPLANAMKQCTNLLILNLSSNNIGKDGAKHVCYALEQCKRLHKLDISDNDLGSDGAMAISDGLKHCSSLLVLKIGRNNIGSEGTKSLAETLRCCIIFQELEINSNNIGSEGVKALSYALHNFTNLYVLDVSSNDIKSVGAEILANALSKCVTLENLNISNNNIGCRGIKLIADNFKCWTNFRELNLSSNSIGNEGAITFAKMTKSCAYLRRLDISNNGISSVGAKAMYNSLRNFVNLHDFSMIKNQIKFGFDAEVLANALIHCKYLSVLDICHYGIDCVGAKCLAEALTRGKCYNFTVIKISFNSLGTDGTKFLADAIKCCSNLEELDISSNKILNAGAEALIDILTSCKKLRWLNMSDNGISNTEALFLALELCSKLQVLYCSSNPIAGVGASLTRSHVDLQQLHINDVGIESSATETIVDALKQYTKLTALDIGHNPIGSVGVNALADVLKQSNTHFLHLDISQCNIPSNEIVVFIQALKWCPNLQTLDISNNNLGNKVITALSESLVFCRDLIKLSVSKCIFPNDSPKALFESFKYCKKLRYLDVSSNHIGNTGASAIAHAFTGNSSLSNLCIKNNSIRSHGAKALAAELVSCSNLNKLDVSFNEIRPSGIKNLTSTLKQCTKLIASNQKVSDSDRGIHP